MRWSVLPLSAALSLGAACAHIGDPPSGSGPLELRVSAPERGTVVPGRTVVVGGTASGAESLQIGDQVVEVGEGGSFETEVELTDGMTVLETVATDREGNEVRDRRAVLAGTFAPQGSAIEDAVVARFTGEAMGAMGDLAAGVAQETDFGAIARELNPVFKDGGCLGVELDVESIDKSSVSMELVPQPGGLALSAEIRDVHADLDADWEVACIGGSSDVDLTADVLKVNAGVLLGIEDGKIGFGLENPQAAFEGFDYDVSGIPDGIIDLFIDDVDDKVAGILVDMIADMVPEVAGDFFADLEEQSFSADVLGVTADVAFRPTEIAFDEEGGDIAIEAAVSFPELDAADFVVSPIREPASGLRQLERGIRLGVADDVANQLIAGFWTAGVLDLSRELPEDFPVKALLGPEVHEMKLDVLLPPMVQGDVGRGITRVTFGDVLLDLLDAQGAVLYRFVVSGALDLRVDVESDFQISIETDAPDLWVSILESNGPAQLNEEQLTSIAELAIKDLGALIDKSLGVIPVPSFGGVTIADPAIIGAPGYMVVGADLVTQP